MISMPSYFRSEEDVRIFFLPRSQEAKENKSQRAFLMTLFKQSFRRPGTRGHFFFHRRCGTINFKPILILEPQGRVDRGIFEGGITRFGETLSGQFTCPKPGYLELHCTRNLSSADVTKYRRIIRKVIKKVTGLMVSGADDRIQIITPSDKVAAKRAANEEARRLAKEKREAARLALAERKRKQAQRKQDAAQRRAAVVDEQAQQEDQAPEPITQDRVDEAIEKQAKEDQEAQRLEENVIDIVAEVEELESQRVMIVDEVESSQRELAIQLSSWGKQGYAPQSLAQLKLDKGVKQALKVAIDGCTNASTRREAVLAWFNEDVARIQKEKREQLMALERKARDRSAHVEMMQQALDKARRRAGEASITQADMALRLAQTDRDAAINDGDDSSEWDAAVEEAQEPLSLAQYSNTITRSLIRLDQLVERRRAHGFDVDGVDSEGVSNLRNHLLKDSKLQAAQAAYNGAADGLRAMGHGEVLAVLLEQRADIVWIVDVITGNSSSG